jgi:DNA-binding CsgD family transcriptional regulator
MQSDSQDQLLKRSRALRQIATSCRLAARELGFESFLLLARFPDASESPVQIVISGLPTEWDRLYDHYQWASIDPLITRAMTTAVPFSSDEVDWQANPRTAAMLGALRLHGLDQLITIPLRGPTAEVGLMSFFRHEALPGDAQQRNLLVSLSQLYSHRIYASLVDQVKVRLRSGASNDGRTLSHRERQALSLAARGDSAKVIAWKLEIKPRTATYFLRRATERMGADTLRQAICKATMNGQLQLAEYPYRLQMSTVYLREELPFRTRVNGDPDFAPAFACQI